MPEHFTAHEVSQLKAKGLSDEQIAGFAKANISLSGVLGFINTVLQYGPTIVGVIQDILNKLGGVGTAAPPVTGS